MEQFLEAQASALVNALDAPIESLIEYCESLNDRITKLELLLYGDGK